MGHFLQPPTHYFLKGLSMFFYEPIDHFTTVHEGI